MTISKEKKLEWPWNCRPSKYHVWKVKSQNVDVCLRCGSIFHRIADGPSGAIYCFATPQWLLAHPEDDKKNGAGII